MPDGLSESTIECMKVTKYPQSCILVETQEVRILIDPGNVVSPSFAAEQFLPLDAILITHEHKDHVDPLIIKEIISNTDVNVYCNQSTANLLSNIATKVVNDGDKFVVRGVEIIARELAHMTLPDGAEGPQNTGYVINGAFFHPGDGKDIDDLLVNTLALPITGPDMSPKESFDFAKKVQAKHVIPIHYDVLGANPEAYKRYANGCNMPFEMIILNNGETAEI
jgi:L-ascorbate metabolism protein UlaG (beta-lactamase superfamily)